MTMRGLAGLSDTALTDAWQWSGHAGGKLQKRDALYLSLQDEQSALAQAPRPATEAEQILVLADQALGELQGLLAQLPDGVLDIPPAAGEWTLREILAHVLLMERRYAQQTSYALRRSDAEPVYRALHVELGASERGGGIDQWIVRLAAARNETYAACSAPDAGLTRMTRWAGYDVDVRFRLHRFAAHIVEHTIQSEKLLAVCVPRVGEAARIVSRIWRTRTAHERRSLPELVDLLDAAHAARAASLVEL